MLKDLFSVHSKKVVLTGAAGGIGRALLRGFLEGGAIVVAVMRQDNTDWQGLDVKYNNTMYPVKCDLGDKKQIMDLISYTEDKLNGCDVLINNASICPKCVDDFYNLDTLKNTMDIVLEAPYLLCAKIAPKMAEQGNGSIINITTMNAELAWPSNPSYITAKSALRMLTKSVARDFGEYGVRANNICPGYVHTKMTDTSFVTPKLYEERCDRTMLGRWATPEDMIGPCLFLASDASSYITGIDLHVEGGWLSKGL